MCPPLVISMHIHYGTSFVKGKLNYLKKRRPKSPLTMLISKVIIFF